MATETQVRNNIITKTAESIPSLNWQSLLTGRALPTSEVAHQTVSKLVGLAVFAADALSSTGYATEAILFTLVAAGAGAFHMVLPISVAIVILIVIVSTSYQQTIHAYPGGGGSYIVARDNLGEAPAQVAGGSLLTDYILTVAVSVSSGVMQIVSAFPVLYNYRSLIAVSLVMFMMVINLRGVRESGMTFTIPIYLFVVMMVITIVVGLFRYFTGTLGTLVNPPEMIAVGAATAVTPFLLLHAFSSGTSAMTGIEAISNGITAFKEPRSRNAGITLIWMSCILAVLFLGISFLTSQINAIPSDYETVISQIGRTVLGGDGIGYLIMLASTALILILAANTSFADFPRLSALQAADGFLPRQLTRRGGRLVFSRGIVVLGVISSVLILIFQANVNRLIPLYAIGVFLSFTLSQAGMARRWWKSGHLKPGEKIQERGSILQFDQSWRLKMVVNGFGAICTFVVMLVFAITKFRDGAWIVIILVPSAVVLFFSINHHYKKLADQLSLANFNVPAQIRRNRVIMPISGVHRGTLAALRFAKTLSRDVTAVHISIDADETEKVKTKWEQWGEEIRLIVLYSPYRLFLEPLLDYIAGLEKIRGKDEAITIVVPQFVPKHWWTNSLHERTAETLRKELLNHDGIIIMEVPYQVA
jgi:amino acid transporter